MSGLARTSRTRFATRASPYHTAVTLFESQDEKPARRSKRVKLETDTVCDLGGNISNGTESEATKFAGPLASSSSTGKKRTAKSPRKPKLIQQSLAVPHPPPPQWQETYNIIKQMRSRITAPVDTMGCDQAQFKETDPKASASINFRSHP